MEASAGSIRHPTGRWHWSLPAAVLACLSLSLLAPPAHGEGLSLEALLRAGLANNRELQLKRQEARTHAADTLLVANAVNPHLEVAAKHNLTDPERPTAEIALSREFRPGIRGKQKRVARAEGEAREAGLKAEEADLVARIRTAYFAWQVADRRMGLQAAVVERWEGLARLAGSQLAQGRLSEVDQAELELNAVRAKRRAFALRSERESHEERLRLLTGEAQGPAPLDTLALDTLPRPPDLALLETWLTRENPVLASLDKSLAAEKQRLALEEGFALPAFSVSLGYEREVEGDNLIGGGVEIPLTVFNRNQAGILKAKSHVREAELRKEAAAAALRSDIAESHRRLQRLAEQYAQYRGQARDLLRKQLRLAEAGFRQGMLGVFELSRVQAEYLAQEGEALDIVEAYHREWNRLGKAVGGELW